MVVFARGRVSSLEMERVSGAIGRLLERYGIPGGARVRVTGANCDDGPLLIQVNLRVGDKPVRVQTMTRGGGDILTVVVRLERRIAELSAPWRPRPWPDAAARPLAGIGPGDLARRKVYPLLVAEPLAAAAVLDAMDYDAHLFTDAETGEDAVIYRAGPTGLKMTRQHRVHPADTTLLTTNPTSARKQTETEATLRLCAYGLPYLFYTDRDTGRGHLLYRRYDADLGLIVPVG
ncbi:sigma 54 modulation/S30EA ribosomal C-terminal domain-containing protein [Nocardia arthritidis]|uniref:Sigma 54 modulation/S30EA ribosomal protein C-terminal domain-containing protein n=1 Tax=Nocardia arthritidis TaxID=228602 RepID=A0A6G9YE33_9NOCA|nr:sigma 54 modulation/S30EA ribosomal C-terminal domain-containing protein [Nocardia arthritidis]QIS11337.1 hypothetical protein F5544_17305 [Nocardia arthritidis]